MMGVTPSTSFTNWVADFSASNHTTPYPTSISSPRLPSFFHHSSIIVGNGSILPVTSICDSVLFRLVYLNDVLITPNLIQIILSICDFTIDNSCFMKFDLFGLSLKDLFVVYHV
jgi:hypothetical protein